MKLDCEVLYAGLWTVDGLDAKLLSLTEANVKQNSHSGTPLNSLLYIKRSIVLHNLRCHVVQSGETFLFMVNKLHITERQLSKHV